VAIKILLTLLLIASFLVENSFATPGSLTLFRTPGFIRPEELAPRVSFWIDIFTKHDRNTVVFHHREYPQVIFAIVDFSKEANSMTERRFSTFKKTENKHRSGAIKNAFQRLASGLPPETAMERSIESQMKFIPGGLSKYRKVVKEDLIRTQTGIKDKFEASLIRSGRYMPVLERIFAEHGLPRELTRLPFVESSFDYKAYSSVGAAGIWQFMPKTAKFFGMKIHPAIDERRDPVEATRAAAKYLIQAYNELGSWPLALTSYNHGIYGVKKAVRAMGTKDIGRIIEYHGKRPFGFASNNFYPEFLAALEVYENYHSYFPNLKLEKPLAFDEIRLGNSYFLTYLSNTLLISKQEILFLNYALSKAAIAGKVMIPRGYVLKVPKGVASRGVNLSMPEPASRAPEMSASSLYGGATHRVRQNETLLEIAKQYKTTTKDLQQINKLGTSNLREGQYLIVKKQKVTPPTQGSSYTVRKGDTLGKISRDFKISIDKLILYNRLKSKVIKPGQRIKIPESGIPKVKQSSSVNSTVRAATKAPNTELREGKVYKVRKGDSLWSISKKFNVNVDKLKKVNHLGGTSLRPGDAVIIP